MAAYQERIKVMKFIKDLARGPIVEARRQRRCGSTGERGVSFYDVEVRRSDRQVLEIESLRLEASVRQEHHAATDERTSLADSRASRCRGSRYDVESQGGAGEGGFYFSEPGPPAHFPDGR